jgi:hypothetical protein
MKKTHVKVVLVEGPLDTIIGREQILEYCQSKASSIEQDFPHHVDILVPPNGLGSQLDAMYDFYSQRGIEPQRGQPRYDAKGSVIRWCFADASVASAFANKFLVS